MEEVSRSELVTVRVDSLVDVEEQDIHYIVQPVPSSVKASIEVCFESMVL